MFPSHRYAWWSPAFLGWPNTCLWQEAGNKFLLINLLVQVLLYLLNCPYHNPGVFARPPIDSPPGPDPQKEAEAGWSDESHPCHLCHLAALPCPSLSSPPPHEDKYSCLAYFFFIFGVTKADNSCTTPQERAMNQL